MLFIKPFSVGLVCKTIYFWGVFWDMGFRTQFCYVHHDVWQDHPFRQGQGSSWRMCCLGRYRIPELDDFNVNNFSEEDTSSQSHQSDICFEVRFKEIGNVRVFTGFIMGFGKFVLLEMVCFVSHILESDHQNVIIGLFLECRISSTTKT